MPDDDIGVRYAVNHQHLKANSSGTVFIAIEIHSLKESKDSSSISSLSLVVDCSCSMRGENFKQAKESALDSFSSLGDNDYLSIISFDKSAKVAFSSSKKSESGSAEDVIRNLRLGIGTNIYEGLSLAYKEFSKQKEEPNNNNTITRRIILLTDGQASAGKTEEKDFVALSRRIREDGITISTIGIGIDYDQQLLHAIAEAGGGVPQHVGEATDLRRVVNKQAEELPSTVIINPTFTITMMPGAKIEEVYTVTPTLRKQSVDPANNGRYVARLKDIIIGQRQTIVVKAVYPSRGPGTYRVAQIRMNDIVKDIECEVTSDPWLHEKETDPYPRIILTASEATSLLNKGVQANDHETIMKAQTIIHDLSQDKDFDDVTTRQPLVKKMAATIRRVVERVSRGPLTESEKKEAIHDTTTFFK